MVALTINYKPGMVRLVSIYASIYSNCDFWLCWNDLFHISNFINTSHESLYLVFTVKSSIQKIFASILQLFFILSL